MPVVYDAGPHLCFEATRRASPCAVASRAKLGFELQDLEGAADPRVRTQAALVVTEPVWSSAGTVPAARLARAERAIRGSQSRKSPARKKNGLRGSS